jgi:ABC-2 type transport system permease protein
MLTSVFAKALRDQRRALVGWGIGTAATIVLMGAIWPSFSGTDIDALIENYPSELGELFNIEAMSTGAGYLNAELFSIVVPAMFIIYAVGRGARLLAGEEEAGTLAIVLTMPIPRLKVLAEKGAGIVVGVGVLALVLGVSVGIVSLLFDMGVSARAAAFGALTQWFIALEFGLLALAVAAATGKRTLAVGIPTGLAAASYMAFLTSQLVDSLAWLQWLSPFHAATTGGPLGPSLPLLVWTMPLVGVVAVAVTAPIFHRRDITG